MSAVCEGCNEHRDVLFVSPVKGRHNHGICLGCVEQYYPETINPLSGALHPCWERMS